MTGDDSKTRLYEAAIELMGRNGITATSTREILNAVGIKNPSAISYHFGSKADLVKEISRELLAVQHPILVGQIQLAAGPTKPTVEHWVAPVVDAAIAMVKSERGCLLARIWWEYDGYLDPQSMEAFLSGRAKLPTAWRAAIVTAFPQFPPGVGLARNVTMLRTVGWMVARMAAINLQSRPFVVREHRTFRLWIEEISATLMSTPTRLTDYDMRPRDRLRPTSE